MGHKIEELGSCQQTVTVVDLNKLDLRYKMHWVLYDAHEKDIHVALAPYGEVTEVSGEHLDAQGVTDKGSTRRIVNLKLKPGVTSEYIHL